METGSDSQSGGPRFDSQELQVSLSVIPKNVSTWMGDRPGTNFDM